MSVEANVVRFDDDATWLQIFTQRDLHLKIFFLMTCGQSFSGKEDASNATNGESTKLKCFERRSSNKMQVWLVAGATKK